MGAEIIGPPLALDVRLALRVMRLLARGRCYHCKDSAPAKPANRAGLRYCADWDACEGRRAAQGKQPPPATMRAALGEVPGCPALCRCP